MIGRRVLADAEGYLKSDYLSQPGDYGRATKDFVAEYGEAGRRNTYWDVKAPDGSGCLLNPNVHTVTEHPDGTISVHPSIVTSTWHGWLKNGIWTSV